MNTSATATTGTTLGSSTTARHTALPRSGRSSSTATASAPSSCGTVATTRMLTVLPSAL
ncbi:hypothetical protein [Saccharothrix sp. BKS2]|uniref:hypothetical protein n=1 Tax=Saccharothrix sp. BKS2 TaxID=3064400 RepID=UPI0039EA28DC